MTSLKRLGFLLLCLGVMTGSFLGVRPASGDPAELPYKVEPSELATRIEDAWVGRASTDGLPSSIAEVINFDQSYYQEAEADISEAHVVVTEMGESVVRIETNLTTVDVIGEVESGRTEYHRLIDSVTSEYLPDDWELAQGSDGLATDIEPSRGDEPRAFNPSSDDRSAAVTNPEPVAVPVQSDPEFSSAYLSSDNGIVPLDVAPDLSNIPLNKSEMAKWAIKYSKVEGMPEFYGDAGNNCANFASSTLNAGGWQAHRIGACSYTSHLNWTHKMPQLLCLGSRYSYTWSRSSNQQDWMIARGGKWRLQNIWTARVGDFLYVDWDPNGTPDGKIDHVMIVTGKMANGDPLISQQTPHRNNIPLQEQIHRATVMQGRTIHWYGLKL